MPNTSQSASYPPFQQIEFGPYTLQDRIGLGGTAEIFLATTEGIEGIEKRLAIKKILPVLSNDERFVRMLVEEAKLLEALRHLRLRALSALDSGCAPTFGVQPYVRPANLARHGFMAFLRQLEHSRIRLHQLAI